MAASNQLGTRHRAFSAATKGKAVDPVTFTVDGDYRIPPAEGDNHWAESFTCLQVVPAGVLDDIYATFSPGANGRRRVNTTTLTGFMRGVLIPEDADRFDDLIHDQDRQVSLPLLAEIMEWLVEQLVENPTTRS